MKKTKKHRHFGSFQTTSWQDGVKVSYYAEQPIEKSGTLIKAQKQKRMAGWLLN